ncbi:MAG: ribosome assembly RNA-binding protein YhbY [Halorhodospira halophila]|uniref:ribosome assembly RNA-binding protein YhbY n=1 Tax=Halorhodospira TaxID=85108 RepID=UPI001911338C|nr:MULTISPECIES: ribosome assembly RNA-binding protein YhbY [Halorhodospira]MBK5936231.1 RNA-binding protein [Halorhodospira halophila]MBK5944090.1 RNA-binding protein [Halorhodospira halophila]MCC3749876.1 ribosome assembly RNA-binding protein YhbY [Halorhodospira halophila]MCG5527796.1 ribosome assembly RNA-binding protein YhbY [Halorhodospira halophila]MCG5532788.1 ribosome assembly RNA-binding protein YhbY [Halorhodospira sp. 9621]
MHLDPDQLKQLRRLGHALKPVVLTGAAGLSEGVLEEIERALDDHELIKVKLAGASKEERQAMTEEIAEQTGAIVVQTIGRIVLLYRENPEKSQVLI